MKLPQLTIKKRSQFAIFNTSDFTKTLNEGENAALLLEKMKNNRGISAPPSAQTAR